VIVALACGFAGLAALLLCAFRVFVGPSLVDRVQAATTAMVCAAVCGACFAALQARALWLDFVLVALLLAVLLACLWLKAFAFGSLQPPLAVSDAQGMR
jgi:multisubunit Na+/H+ antiporter MnhF subunit